MRPQAASTDEAHPSHSLHSGDPAAHGVLALGLFAGCNLIGIGGGLHGKGGGGNGGSSKEVRLIGTNYFSFFGHKTLQNSQILHPAERFSNVTGLCHRSVFNAKSPEKFVFSCSAGCRVRPGDKGGYKFGRLPCHKRGLGRLSCLAKNGKPCKERSPLELGNLAAFAHFFGPWS